MNNSDKNQELHRQLILLMAKHSLCLTKVGRKVNYQRQAINYHLHLIQDKTGLDPRSFYDLCELLEYIKEGKL